MNARQIIEGTLPTNLLGMPRQTRLKPNHIYVWGNDWHGSSPEPSVISYPYSGDPVEAVKNADSDAFAPHVILATDDRGAPWKVISPNFRHVADFGTPDADYIAGDVYAHQKALARQVKGALETGDVALADEAITKKVAELRATRARYDGYIKTNQQEIARDKAALRAGKTIRDIDPRFDDPKEYFDNLRRHCAAFRDEQRKIDQEIERWQAMLPKRVGESMTSTEAREKFGNPYWRSAPATPTVRVRKIIPRSHQKRPIEIGDWVSYEPLSDDYFVSYGGPDYALTHHVVTAEIPTDELVDMGTGLQSGDTLVWVGPSGR